MEKTISKYENDIEDIERSRKAILKKAKEEAAELLKESNKRIENAIREIKESQAEKKKPAVSVRNLIPSSKRFRKLIPRRPMTKLPAR